MNKKTHDEGKADTPWQIGQGSQRRREGDPAILEGDIRPEDVPSLSPVAPPPPLAMAAHKISEALPPCQRTLTPPCVTKGSKLPSPDVWKEAKESGLAPL